MKAAEQALENLEERYDPIDLSAVRLAGTRRSLCDTYDISDFMVIKGLYDTNIVPFKRKANGDWSKAFARNEPGFIFVYKTYRDSDNAEPEMLCQENVVVKGKTIKNHVEDKGKEALGIALEEMVREMQKEYHKTIFTAEMEYGSGDELIYRVLTSKRYNKDGKLHVFMESYFRERSDQFEMINGLREDVLHTFRHYLAENSPRRGLGIMFGAKYGTFYAGIMTLLLGNLLYPGIMFASSYLAKKTFDDFFHKQIAIALLRKKSMHEWKSAIDKNKERFFGDLNLKM